jgi:hypothetical protein
MRQQGESGPPLLPNRLPPFGQDADGQSLSGCTSMPSAASAPLLLFSGE